jgi:hypothetical protein
MVQTKKYMNTLDETQFWDEWGALKLRLAQKKQRKKIYSNIQSGVRKMIAWVRGERKIKPKLMKLIVERDGGY